jgi:predicted aspartyl protease
MDELFWGHDHEDVGDWAERLSMAAEVRNLNADKLFKIAKLNLRGRVRDWFRRLQPAPADWIELRTLILQKCGNVDADDIRMKLDAIKQEPKERVQKYFERMDKLFRRGNIPDAEQRRRFLGKLRPEIRKICVVRTYTDIEEMVGAATELERVLGELGETPFEPLKEEQEEGVAETMMERQFNAFNETLVNFMKGSVSKPITTSSSTSSDVCQICKGRDHTAVACPRLNEPRAKCAKCGMPHRTENCSVKCSFCAGLRHTKDRCWKKPKDGRMHPGSANFLEVMLDDEKATQHQLNRLCGDENLFSYTRVPRRRMHVEVTPTATRLTARNVMDRMGSNREESVQSKILSHFIKGKISLTPMETVMMIPGELEHLESLMKVARKKKKKDADMAATQVSVVSAVPMIRRLSINKTHRSKTLHLSVEINHCLIEGLVDTGASMFVMAASVVRELGLMHLVSGSETYKIASGAMTQALDRIEEVPIKVGEVQCSMTFMVVDTDSYDIQLGLDLLIKIGAIVDVEQGLIQVRRGPGADVEILPLSVVNLIQRSDKITDGHNRDAIRESRPANSDGIVQVSKQGADDRRKVEELESDSNSNEDFNELDQLINPDADALEFEDTEFEELIKEEGP